MQYYNESVMTKDKKTIVVDFSDIGSFCGFGEIERNYAPKLAEALQDEVNLVYILPEPYIGKYGDRITYIDRRTDSKEIGAMLPKIDLWHSSNQLLKRKLPDKGIKRLLTIHDVNFLYEKSGLRRLNNIFRLKRNMRRADYYVAISNYVKEDILKHFPTYGRDIDVIYNGVAEQSQEMERPSFIDEDTPFFVTIGQVREKKNFHKLVPMMQHLPGYKLYICGDDHFAFANKLRGIIMKEGDGNVVMTGKITDKEKNWMYAHAAAYLFPSRLEGFGIPGLEAMRYGCPVFSSKLASLPEVCGDYAFYWDDFDPVNMSRTVIEGLERFAATPDIARKANEHSRRFNYDRYTAEHVALYRKLLAE